MRYIEIKVKFLRILEFGDFYYTFWYFEVKMSFEHKNDVFYKNIACDSQISDMVNK